MPKSIHFKSAAIGFLLAVLVAVCGGATLQEHRDKWDTRQVWEIQRKEFKTFGLGYPSEVPEGWEPFALLNEGDKEEANPLVGILIRRRVK
jgi:hypothetical protein